MAVLLSLLAAKGLGTLLSSLLLGAQNAPGLTMPVLSVQSETVYVETKLQRCFNRPLDQVLLSGSPVAAGFTVALETRDPAGALLEAEPATFIHSAVYDPATATFALYRSELGGTADSVVCCPTVPEVKRLFAALRAPLASADVVPEHAVLRCRVEVALNTIVLEAPEGRELDLNAFWDYHYPRAVTAWQGPER
jgi:hypothetical protein